MYDKFINQLSHELDMADCISSKEPNHYTLSFDRDIDVEVIKSDQRYSFKSTIGACPKQNAEVFLLRMLEANLFGLGTKGAVLGLNEKENMLTLTQEVDDNCSFPQFKNKLEDFVNVTVFWRNEALA